jgi:hypothetical protein
MAVRWYDARVFRIIVGLIKGAFDYHAIAASLQALSPTDPRWY